MTSATAHATRDPYRFGPANHPALQPGSLGWTVDDLRDPETRALWDAGRFEILYGVLTTTPPALFDGGAAVQNIMYLVRDHLRARNEPFESAAEVDIAIDPARVVRADAVFVCGRATLDRFKALTFPPPDTSWRRNPLTLPPTLVIESVSRGHELHDRTTKRAWYAEFGVPNYWILDAFARSLECLRLAPPAFATTAFGAGQERITPKDSAGW